MHPIKRHKPSSLDIAREIKEIQDLEERTKNLHFSPSEEQTQMIKKMIDQLSKKGAIDYILMSISESLRGIVVGDIKKYKDDLETVISGTENNEEKSELLKSIKDHSENLQKSLSEGNSASFAQCIITRKLLERKYRTLLIASKRLVNGASFLTLLATRVSNLKTYYVKAFMDALRGLGDPSLMPKNLPKIPKIKEAEPEIKSEIKKPMVRAAKKRPMSEQSREKLICGDMVTTESSKENKFANMEIHRIFCNKDMALFEKLTQIYRVIELHANCMRKLEIKGVIFDEKNGLWNIFDMIQEIPIIKFVNSYLKRDSLTQIAKLLNSVKIHKIEFQNTMIEGCIAEEKLAILGICMNVNCAVFVSCSFCEAPEILNGLFDLQNLRELRLKKCKITDGLASIIAEKLKKNTKLKKLDLRQNPIKVEGCEKILGVCKENQTLEELYLTNLDSNIDKISPEVIKIFEERTIPLVTYSE